MASQPPELPQSIVLSQFHGLRNTVTQERLGLGELEAAVNVDIDDAGQLRRRRGQVRISSAKHHSLVGPIAGQRLAVREGMLGSLSDGYVFTPLVWVGLDPLTYTAVGNDIYFSSDTVSGKIIDGVALPWGTDGGGLWISPVMTPTDTLGAIVGRQLKAPPRATEIEAYKGRIYLAAGPVLWATELYAYDHVDKDKNYVLMEHDITMVRAVTDGLYVGTTAALYFLQGVLSKGLQLNPIVTASVVRGSAVVVPYSKVHPQARQGPVPEGEGPVFMTSAGICLGLDGGQVFNLTQERVVFPEAQRAAALYREDQGANAYIAVADSAGGPRANSRIGDYADAEIVRASQRG
jgi:hypothetical protein